MVYITHGYFISVSRLTPAIIFQNIEEKQKIFTSILIT